MRPTISDMLKQRKNQNFKNFTLVELLVVVSVLAILLSLLFPSLERMLYNGKTTACVSKLKDISVGIFLYCDDNYDVYPTDTECYHFNCNRCTNDGVRGVRAAASLSARSYNSYKSANSVHYDLATPLKPYFGGFMKPAFHCPHMLENRSSYKQDSNTYQLYFRTRENYYIDTPMLKLGERWQMSSSTQCKQEYRGKWFNILAGDMVNPGSIRNPWYHYSPKPPGYSSQNWSVWRASHIPFGSELVEDTWEGRFWNKGMGGTSTDSYMVSYRKPNQYAQGNFLHDDGSVISADLFASDPATAWMAGPRYLPGNKATDGQ